METTNDGKHNMGKNENYKNSENCPPDDRKGRKEGRNGITVT